MSAGFTPGPWFVTYTRNGTANVGPTHNCTVAALLMAPIGEMEANAQLIAAAPLLLQELRGASTQMEMAAECIEDGRYDEALLHVRSMSRPRRVAIAAATGTQP